MLEEKWKGKLKVRASPENIDTSNIIQINRYVCMYTCMYVCNNNEKCGHEFENDQVVLYRRVFREEREERNIVIIFLATL